MEISNELIAIVIPVWIILLGGFLSAFLITGSFIPSLIKLARLKGLYDLPNGRTSHLRATPYLGGIAVFAGFVITTILMTRTDILPELIYLLAGFIILLFIGLKDDILRINPLHKLAGQLIAAGIIAVFADVRINNLYGCFGFEGIPYIPSILITMFVFIVIINGSNLIDGIDGLASGVCILISLTLGIWFTASGFIPYAVMCFSLAGALIAFFYFNVFGKKNKIFLGDTGSLILGLALSVLIVRFIGYQSIAPKPLVIHSAPAVAFGILIIPLFDTLRVFILRISQRRSPFSADRQHLHHLLLDIGYSHIQTTSILLLSNLFFIVASVGLQQLKIMHLISLQLLVATGLSFLAAQLLKRKREQRYFQKGFIGKEIQLLTVNGSDNQFEGDKTATPKRKSPHLMKISNA